MKSLLLFGLLEQRIAINLVLLHALVKQFLHLDNLVISNFHLLQQVFNFNYTLLVLSFLFNKLVPECIVLLLGHASDHLRSVV